jgi:hypothetical protein
MTFFDEVPTRFGYNVYRSVLEIGIKGAIHSLGDIRKGVCVTREPSANIEHIEMEPVLFGFIEREAGILDGSVVRFRIATVASDMEIDPGQFMFGLFGKCVYIVEFGEAAPELGAEPARRLTIVHSNSNNESGFGIG